jgi:hypothetical protein
MDPKSPALSVAAERYYSKSARSVDILQNRIHESLARLVELRALDPDRFQIRVTGEPLAMGMIVVGDSAGRPYLAIAEYYTFQAPGEPMFALGPADEPWLGHFVGEAEAYWQGGNDWPTSR